ncbi:MAG: DUF1653 domain-containing protein [Bacilli bacterium]
MEVKIGHVYKHFKGNLYKVLMIANDSSNEKELVIYEALYGSHKIWARPLEEFISKTDKIKYPNCQQESRFMLID